MRRLATLFIIGCGFGAAVMFWLDGGGRDREPSAASTTVLDTSGQSEQIAARIPPISRETDEAITLDQLAIEDLDAALGEAIQISDPISQRLATERIAAIWAARDPLAALAMADQLPARLRSAARAAIDTEWARLDARGYLAFIESNPKYLKELIGHGHWDEEPILERSGGIRLVLASDPLSVLRLADNLSSRTGTTLETLALTAYAEREPFSALSLVEQIPPGQKRNEALAAFATGYALADPEGALAWARNLSPPPTSVLGNVLNVIAKTDVRRAVNLAVQLPWSGNPQFPPINALVLKAGEDSTQAALAGDSLLATNAPRKDYRLSILLQSWANHDPESVVAWIRTNAAALSDEVVSGPAFALGSTDPALAARYTDQIPSALRASWIERVAQGYALADPASALDWISRYEGQAGYEVGMRLVLANYVADDLATAARTIESANTDIQLGSAGVVADRWARQDGPAAADWALGLNDSNVRAAALSEAVGAWMAQSSQGAEDWTLALPRSEDRDRALYVLIRGRTYTDAPRESYSTNPTEALIAQISNPAMRREVEAWFEGE